MQSNTDIRNWKRGVPSSRGMNSGEREVQSSGCLGRGRFRGTSHRWRPGTITSIKDITMFMSYLRILCFVSMFFLCSSSVLST
jgi:hypothetical protein